jgi:hypothetical protein
MNILNTFHQSAKIQAIGVYSVEDLVPYVDQLFYQSFQKTFRFFEKTTDVEQFVSE